MAFTYIVLQYHKLYYISRTQDLLRQNNNRKEDLAKTPQELAHSKHYIWMVNHDRLPEHIPRPLYPTVDNRWFRFWLVCQKRNRLWLY